MLVVGIVIAVEVGREGRAIERSSSCDKCSVVVVVITVEVLVVITVEVVVVRVNVSALAEKKTASKGALHFRCMSNTSQIHVRYMSDTFQIHVRNMSGTCLTIH